MNSIKTLHITITSWLCMLNSKKKCGKSSLFCFKSLTVKLPFETIYYECSEKHILNIACYDSV